jgi:integrase
VTIQHRDSPATAAELDAARLLLAKMGITPSDLVAESDSSDETAPEVPTLEVWVPKVAGLLSPTTARSYGSYWNKALAEWTGRRLDEITASEIKALSEKVRATAVVRSNSRGGRTAAENFIAAMRCLYRYAEQDQLIDERHNPARRVTKPRRSKSTRRALPDARIAELNDVVSSTGDDPELDALIVRLHEETACRRGGALALRPRDLDRQQCLIHLREKDGTTRWQPVSPTLMRHLDAHAEERGTGNPGDQLLRYANGTPITSRRYDYIWKRVRDHLDWAARLQISAHWLRHTTLTWVERNFGYAIAHAYAGHTGSADNATSTYIKADITEIATALSALTGEPHPLTPPTAA